jgi:multidrug transporter EmrE-like cation transporter
MITLDERLGLCVYPTEAKAAIHSNGKARHFVFMLASQTDGDKLLSTGISNTRFYLSLAMTKNVTTIKAMKTMRRTSGKLCRIVTARKMNPRMEEISIAMKRTDITLRKEIWSMVGTAIIGTTCPLRYVAISL